MGQFERTRLIIEEPYFNLVQQKVVCVIGLGGVGATCVESLIRTGIENLVIVDHDKIELSNLNRQIQSSQLTLGLHKTTALKNKMLEINPKAKITTITDFLDTHNFDLLKQHKVDFVVDAIDSLDAKINLIEYCVKNKITIISSCGMGNRKDPSKITISRLDKTFNDPMAKRIRIECRKRQCDKIKVVFSSELPLKREKPLASLSFVVNVAGQYLASEIIKEIGEQYETSSH